MESVSISPKADDLKIKACRKDILLIFLMSFIVHEVALFFLMTYFVLAMGLDTLMEHIHLSVPIITVGFFLAFAMFNYWNKNSLQFFFLGRERPLLKMQQELLNYPKMSILGFVIWAVVGFLICLGLIKNDWLPMREAIIHVGIASFYSGLLVAIMHANLVELIIQRNLVPFLLSNTRISEIPNIVSIPTYTRIILLVLTNAVAPSIFILMLYQIEQASGYLLLFFLAFTIFNGFWQGFFLLRNVSQPIGQIAGKLERFRKGELEEDAKPIWRNDSLGKFSEMFDDLVSSIHERDFIRSTFNRYLDPSLVDNILNGEQELGGSEREATVMFADIRDFTSMSEQLAPSEVVDLLNQYFEEMVQEIIATDGIPDKFLGDGLLAVWGLGGDDHNQAQKCCSAALAMLDRLESINKQHEVTGQPGIQIGIGIHSGSVIAGNIGSQKKMEYTVIGDTVNTSSRLEGLCKQLCKPLTISGKVYDQLTPSMQEKFEFQISKQLRGKQSETRIYCLKTED